MTFEKQVKEAKAKKLEYRILKDVLFIIFGITFLLVTIFTNVKDNKKEKKVIKKTTTTTTVIKKLN